MWFECFAHKYVCVPVHARCWRRPEEGGSSLGTGVTNTCESSYGCWDWNPTPLLEQKCPESQNQLFIPKKNSKRRLTENAGKDVGKEEPWFAVSGGAMNTAFAGISLTMSLKSKGRTDMWPRCITPGLIAKQLHILPHSASVFVVHTLTTGRD